MRCQKTTEKKGTRGDVTSCLGLPENGRNGGSEGVVAICRNPPGVTRFEGRVAENCLYPLGNGRNKRMRRSSHELSGNGIDEGRDWGWYELT